MNRYTWRTATLEGVLIACGLAFFLPVYILLNQSLKNSHDGSSPLAPVTSPTLSNFAEAWERASLGSALVVSLIVTLVSVVVIVFLSAMAAYPLARAGRRWSTLAFYGFMIGLLLPFQLGMVPLYTTMRDLGLLGSPVSLILFYSGSQLPFSIFMYTGFLRSIPPDYEEAAGIDGCSPVAAFWRVVFPLLRPVTGTIAILNVITIWNDFLTPLLYLSGSGKQTLPLAVFSFVGKYVSEWNIVFAGLAISIAPVLLAYFVMQRTIIRGFAGGLKG